MSTPRSSSPPPLRSSGEQRRGTPQNHDRDQPGDARCTPAGARSAPPDPPDPGGQGRRGQRLPDLGAVDDDDAHRRRQRDPPADRRADRDRLRHRARCVSQPGRRRGAAGDRPALADPGHRRHPLPAEVRLRGDRRRLRRGPGEPGQHPQVRRPGQGDRGGGQGPRHVDPDRCQRRLARPAAAGEVRQGHARGAGRVRGVGGLACSRSTTSTTSRSRSSTTTRS